MQLSEWANVAMVERDGVCWIKLDGDVDLTAAPALAEVMATVQAWPTLHIDLSEVTFMDLAGAKTIFRTMRRSVDAPGQDFVLKGTSPTVRHVLELAGLTDLAV